MKADHDQLKKITLALAALLLTTNAMPSLAAHGVQTKTSQCVASQTLPDSNCTPGAVLTTNIDLICRRGYTKTVRGVSLTEKKKVFSEYGIPWSSHSNYEMDHLIALEIGGSNEISNLWPEVSNITNGAKTKDKLENYLHAQICSNKISVQRAQYEIASNWLQYYPTAMTSTKKISKPQASNLDQKVSTPTPETSLAYPLQNQPQQTTTTEFTDNKPTGTTALCNDGTYSFSQTRKGACSHHGGISKW